ncbi:glycoside hydrolase family 9 protein [Herbivorax sp. ANBcel31]|uniref:glycoside hydrolase family 9 protein n=1 Tax=Herbivorax sp. ANBcel31 TaxID=3069754 RepID=UPI0027B4E724|nr:glycoside hydrolase family 9 protein [Herbivorax sp. ANBcel31]MDQ2085004.1 glycoside hydrolase family 9 protein [Herbivorax sp. ANBcel31]
MLKKLTLVSVLVFALLATSVGGFAWTDIITNNDFEGDVGLPWHVTEDFPAEVEFEIAYNEFVIHVIDSGVDQWGVQFRHRNIPIESGMNYRLSFTVQADANCRIYTKIGEMDGDYEEYWNNDWMPHELQANQWYTHEAQFTANANNESAEWAFHIGDGTGTQYTNATVPSGTTLRFTNMYLEGQGYQPPPPPEPTPRKEIRVNQVGYYPNSDKIATLIGSASTWELKDTSGSTVADGNVTSFGQDADSGDNVSLIDFSDFTDTGTYYLEAGGERSYEFRIDNDIYSDIMYDALKYFYYNRAAQPIEATYSHDPSFARPAGHTNDIATPVEFANANIPAGSGTVDVTGGWYDAGDYGKYVVNGGMSTWTMQNQYERALEHGRMDDLYGDGMLDIPESGSGLPDILEEARINLEFMLKMQKQSGSRAGMAYHKAHDERWTALGLGPHESDAEDMERVVKPPTTAATLNLAAAAAQGSRLWEEYDPSFASELIQAAEAAWDAALANPDLYAPFTATMGGGPYGDNYVEDDFYWAACELLITTGNSEYYDYISGSTHFLEMPDEMTGGEAELGLVGAFDWGNTQGAGTLSLALNQPDALSSNEIDTIIDNIAAACDVWIGYQDEQGYGITIQQRPVFYDDPDLVGYPWGSNSFVLNQGITFAYAYDLTGDEKYYNALTTAMDYIMGRNPMNQCYVTGYGDVPLENPHHRWFAYQSNPSYPKAPPGWVSGGPNSGLQDPWVKGSGWQPAENPPQKCFMDHIESWSTNEVTINWNAPFAWVTGYLTEIAEFGPVDGPPLDDDVMLGDINGDGVIDSTDATMLSRLILDIPVPGADVDAADINGDGNIDTTDYALLSRHILEISSIN